jgi:hypothetical protein
MGAMRRETAMIQLTKDGPRIDDACVSAMADQFARTHHVVLSQFLATDVLAEARRYLDAATWNAGAAYTADGAEFARELTVRGTDMAIHVLLMRLNHSRVFDAVRRITGCAAIESFSGRIYRMMPDSEHYDSWHDDVMQSRMIGLSINLSSGVYEGGRLRLRERAGERELGEVANVGLGDALMFRISPDLQHLVTPVSGTVPKTACAGWFRGDRPFASLLQDGR